MRGLHVARRGREWSPLLLLALVLCGGLAWGLATAFATTSPPSPSSGNVVLRLGWTEEPDNLNVFIGYQDTSYEIWALNYDTLFGASDRNQPTLNLVDQWPTTANGGISDGGKVWTMHIRSGVRFDDGTPLTLSGPARERDRALRG